MDDLKWTVSRGRSNGRSQTVSRGRSDGRSQTVSRGRSDGRSQTGVRWWFRWGENDLTQSRRSYRGRNQDVLNLWLKGRLLLFFHSGQRSLRSLVALEVPGTQGRHHPAAADLVLRFRVDAAEVPQSDSHEGRADEQHML